MKLANYFILKMIPNNTDKNINIHINISINTNQINQEAQNVLYFNMLYGRKIYPYNKSIYKK